jgi:toluene monooxygenase system protein E
MKGMKTWSALAKNRRRPSEYEVVTTNLQTRTRHPDQAYELSPAPDLPMNEFYLRNVSESPLQHEDWEGFRDPDELIYRVYTRIQDQQEQYVDGLLDEHNEIGHDKTLSAEWLAALEKFYTPRRYLQMALQMGAAYLVQIVPASTITACAGFQDGDEYRWLSRVAYRTRELQVAHPDRGFGKTERKSWEEEPAWQGFRELLEKALATYDWGEHFVALNLVAKPAADEAHRQLGRTARRFDDGLLSLIADNQMRDSDRSRRWSGALVTFACENEANKAVLRGWVDKWMPLARQAVEAYCGALPEQDDAVDAALAAVTTFHRGLGLAD